MPKLVNRIVDQDSAGNWADDAYCDILCSMVYYHVKKELTVAYLVTSKKYGHLGSLLAPKFQDCKDQNAKHITSKGVPKTNE